VKYLGLALTAILLALTSCASKSASDLTWLSSIEEGVTKARARGTKILVLFTNPARCPPCRMMVENTFPDSEVQAVLKSFVLVKPDITDQAQGTLSAQKYNVRAIPTIVILDSNGRQIGRAVGYMPPKAFISELSKFRK